MGLLFGSAMAVAGPKIKQIDTSNERVAIQATKATTVGSEWMASKNGQQCTLEVTDVLGKLAILDASDCDIFEAANEETDRRILSEHGGSNSERFLSDSSYESEFKCTSNTPYACNLNKAKVAELETVQHRMTFMCSK